MLKLLRQRTQKSKYAKREFAESNFIPYQYHWNDHTLLTKKNELMQVIKFGGYSFETADDEDVDIRKNIRNLLLKGVGVGNISIYFHVIRRKQSVFQDSDENDLTIKKSKIPDGFSAYIEQEWKKKHKSQHSFVNELYLSVILKTKSTGGLRAKADKASIEQNFKTGYEELDEFSTRVTTTLRDYKPKILGTYETDHGVYSEILEFLSKIVNPGTNYRMLVPKINISKYLPAERLYFGQKAIEIRGATGSQFAGIVSIKEYAQHTSANIMDGFLQMPFECVISQSFSFIDRQNAITKMKIQQGRMINAGDDAISQVAQISEALDDAMSGRVGFGKHHLTVMCIEKSPKALETVLAMAATELSNTGAMPVRERVNLEPCFWAQLPGNADFAARRATINTLNLASFSSLHNYPTGKAYGNHWGEYVTILDTTSGTPFYFNFHVRDVGHTTIIGPTGAGKTVLMNFLCAQARKYNCRMFFFDKDRGAEIFLRSLNAVYTVIDPSKVCGFNPLQLEDSGDNRNFLSEWLRLLVTVHGEPISAENIDRINDAINGNYKLAKKDRVLRNIVPFLGMGGPGSLAGRIGMWHGNGSHAKVFDNDEDTLDLSSKLTFGFEMAELLKDKNCLGPVLLYLFHKINMSLDGRPTMIVLDEAWALIDNNVFAPKIKDWLKVLRKLNCFVIFATQSVEDASKSSISDTLIQQTATQIFLPNLKATSVYRTHFMLSEREFILIKTTEPSSRYFLVKQAMDAVVARIDLGGMDNVINVLSGRADTVRLLDRIRAEVGDDPDVWLPEFWEQVKHIGD